MEKNETRTVRVVIKGKKDDVYLAIEKLAEFTNELERQLDVKIIVD